MEVLEIEGDEVDIDDLVITGDDMERALTIVDYSVRCLFALIDATGSKNQPTKRKLEMPSEKEIDEDFIMIHKLKVKKLFNSSIDGEIMVANVTKNHIYPQIGHKPSSEDARTFLKGLEMNGVGTLKPGGKVFEFR